MTMRKKLIAISVLACSLLAMLFSFFNIVNWIEDNKKTKDKYNANKRLIRTLKHNKYKTQTNKQNK